MKVKNFLFCFSFFLLVSNGHAGVVDDIKDFFNRDCFSFNLDGERLGGSGTEHVQCCHIPGGWNCQIRANNYTIGIGNYWIGLHGSVFVSLVYDLPYMTYVFDGAMNYDFMGKQYNLVFQNLTYKYLGFYIDNGLKCANQISGQLVINNVPVDAQTLQALFCKPSAFLLW